MTLCQLHEAFEHISQLPTEFRHLVSTEQLLGTMSGKRFACCVGILLLRVLLCDKPCTRAEPVTTILMVLWRVRCTGKFKPLLGLSMDLNQYATLLCRTSTPTLSLLRSCFVGGKPRGWLLVFPCGVCVCVCVCVCCHAGMNAHTMVEAVVTHALFFVCGVLCWMSQRNSSPCRRSSL